MSREKQNIKTTDWLTKGISKEQLEREKQEAIMSADLEECFTEFRSNGEIYVDFDAMAEKLTDKGYRKATDFAEEIFAEIDGSFSQMIEEAGNTISEAIQEENKSVARVAEYGRDVLFLARNTLTKILKKKYPREMTEDGE